MMSNKNLEKYGKDGRRYEARPGRTPLEDTLKKIFFNILDYWQSRMQERLRREYLGEDNAAVLMATSGARGSMDNLAMMAGSIGQPKVTR